MKHGKFRKGDKVIVISGNDKGKIGSILAFAKDRVVVEGVNLRKKHIKKSQEFPKGKIVEFECPIHISNVNLCVNDKAVKTIVRFVGSTKELCYKTAGGQLELHRVIKERAN